MPNMSLNELKAIWPYAFGAIPFIALFAYEMAAVLPHRPLKPDMGHGYTIPIGIAHKTVYMSTGDGALLFGAWLCAAAVIVTGLWRMGMFRRFLQR